MPRFGGRIKAMRTPRGIIAAISMTNLTVHRKPLSQALPAIANPIPLLVSFHSISDHETRKSYGNMAKAK